MTSIILYAQKVKTVSAQYIYYAPENISIEEAKHTALERAKIQAIADEFGTTISQTNITNVQNVKSDSGINFQSIGMSEVKGDWIEDLDSPKYNIQYIEGSLVIEVAVKGKARELKIASYECVAKVLRNKDDKNETTSFNDGDQFVLSFQSSSNGYLVVYLSDNQGTVSCLLPYAMQSEPSFKVKANNNYLLFDQSISSEDYVDEYYLTSGLGSTENNQLFIVFSKNNFSKALDSQRDSNTELILPRELSEAEFLKWLSKSRQRDPEMSVIKKVITVSNK